MYTKMLVKHLPHVVLALALFVLAFVAALVYSPSGEHTSVAEGVRRVLRGFAAGAFGTVLGRHLAGLLLKEAREHLRATVPGVRVYRSGWRVVLVNHRLDRASDEVREIFVTLALDEQAGGGDVDHLALLRSAELLASRAPAGVSA